MLNPHAGNNRFTLQLLFCLLAACVLWIPLCPDVAAQDDGAPQIAVREPPFTLPPADELSKIKSAELITSKGTIVFKLFPEQAPWHVANFKLLADRGYYRGHPFRKYSDRYILQAGGSKGNAGASIGYNLPAEFSSLEHIPGALGMGRWEDLLNYERRSSGNQFHILLRSRPRMDGNYTIFGQVVSGMEVIEQLQSGDIIRDLKVYVTESP